MDEVAALARRARGRGARVILNAAPAATLPAALLADVDVLIVNELEATAARRIGRRRRAGCLPPAGGAVAQRRRDAGAGAVRSAFIAVRPALNMHPRSTSSTPSARATRSPRRSRPRSIGATPSTSAIRQAVAAGTLACGVAGAQASLPTREAIDRLAATLGG